MELFLVRVVLHSKTDLGHNIYALLHLEMEKSGFTRKIKSNTGYWYHLPPAEYLFSSNLRTDQIKDVVENIVKAIDIDCAVIVYQLASSSSLWASWEGLKLVR